MTINEKITRIREELCGNDNKLFAEKLGCSTQYASNICKNGKSVGDTTKTKILNAFPMVSRSWLLASEGEMLKKELPSRTDNATIPLLPISAQGGSLNDFAVSVCNEDCERIISPIPGVDFALSVNGDSMTPDYPSGSQIFIKKINESAFIEWGKVYVLDTCNGSVIKKILPTNEDGKVKCISINPEYPPFEVSLNDVYGIYRVLACMSIK